MISADVPASEVSADPPAAAGAAAIQVRVRLFASLRERAGWSEQLVTPQATPATALSLWRQLGLAGSDRSGDAPPAAALPPGSGAADAPAVAADRADGGGAGALPPGVRVAINQGFASPGRPLADGDELAFLPPISGG